MRPNPAQYEDDRIAVLAITPNRFAGGGWATIRWGATETPCFFHYRAYPIRVIRRRSRSVWLEQVSLVTERPQGVQARGLSNHRRAS